MEFEQYNSISFLLTFLTEDLNQTTKYPVFIEYLTSQDISRVSVFSAYAICEVSVALADVRIDASGWNTIVSFK